MVYTSTNPKYCALTYSTYELQWLESLLDELGIPFYTPTLLCVWYFGSNSKLDRDSFMV